MSDARRSAKLAVDAGLLDEAMALNIDPSRAAEIGIARAVHAERAARRWADENADIVRSNNEYVRKHGLPLRKYRSF